MFVTAFNQQFGLDRHGAFCIGRLPLSLVVGPDSAAAAIDSERGFLGRYREWLLDEIADVQGRVRRLQDPMSAR